MTNKNIFRELGGLDPDLIAKAAPDVAQKKPAKKTWVKWASLAACFCLMLTIGAIVMPMFQNNPNIDDFDNTIHYTSMQDVEQVIGANTLLSNISTDNFEYVGYDLHYLDGKDKLPTVLEGLYGNGTPDTPETVQIYCSFPHYRGEMATLDHFLPSSVLPSDFPDNKGETEDIEPLTLLTTSIGGIEISYYQYIQGADGGHGNLGTFEINEHVYIVQTFSLDNENLFFEILNELLVQE